MGKKNELADVVVENDAPPCSTTALSAGKEVSSTATLVVWFGSATTKKRRKSTRIWKEWGLFLSVASPKAECV